MSDIVTSVLNVNNVDFYCACYKENASVKIFTLIRVFFADFLTGCT